MVGWIGGASDLLPGILFIAESYIFVNVIKQSGGEDLFHDPDTVVNDLTAQPDIILHLQHLTFCKLYVLRRRLMSEPPDCFIISHQINLGKKNKATRRWQKRRNDMFICLHVVYPFLRQEDTDEENLSPYVHVESIIDFFRSIKTRAGRREEYTVIHLANNDALTVRETPEEILSLINGASNNA